MAHAAVADLLVRFDKNLIADLGSDTGTAIAGGSLAADANLLAALASASGQINAACTVGKIYSTADLATLTNDDLAYLKDLTCCIAMANLLRRRASPQHLEQYKVLAEWCEAILDQLRRGQRVFAIDDNRDAGLPTVDGPTVAELDSLRTVTYRTSHYWPSGYGLPSGRGEGY